MLPNQSQLIQNDAVPSITVTTTTTMNRMTAKRFTDAGMVIRRAIVLMIPVVQAATRITPATWYADIRLAPIRGQTPGFDHPTIQCGPIPSESSHQESMDGS